MSQLQRLDAVRSNADLELNERERTVLRALVAAHIAEAAPVGSAMLSHLLPVPLSSASIRSTVAALRERGLVEQPHKSAGSVPTVRAIEVFISHLMDEPELAEYERRSLRDCFDGLDGSGAVHRASTLLSERARQLGFVVAPSLSAIRVQHVSFVRVATERVLVVLVACSGRVHRRTVEHSGVDDQRELDRIASALNQRIVGHTLPEVLPLLRTELAQLRDRASDLLVRALSLGLQALELDDPGDPDLLLGTRLALLGQPEFTDLQQVRELFAAIETGAWLVDLVGRLTDDGGVHVALGDALEVAELNRFALVAAPYGREGEPAQGVLGVIGPCRMDYRRVIPLVEYCSTIVSDKLALAHESGRAPQKHG
jgi:heat-inducible transcriptional repressor